MAKYCFLDIMVATFIYFMMILFSILVYIIYLYLVLSPKHNSIVLHSIYMVSI